jgi:hypothetical protein
MAINTRPFQFRDYLPEVYRNGDGIKLTVQSVAGTTITVSPFSSGSQGFPSGTPVTTANNGGRTVLAQAVPANVSPLTQIQVKDAAFAGALHNGDTLDIFTFQRRFFQAFETLFEQLESEIEGTADLASGGIPDLFSPSTTPPPQFANRPQPGPGDFDFLNYLAGWLALPLRPEKSLDWNRQFFNTAVPLYSQRSTLPGIDAMLRAWLKGELLDVNPAALAVTDLTSSQMDADAAFQLGVTSTVGVDTVLGEGPPFFFVADLIADPSVTALHAPTGLDVMQRAAKSMLDAEKPAHTYYELRVRASTMQLAQPNQTSVDGDPSAQIGATTLLWKDPWVYESD